MNEINEELLTTVKKTAPWVIAAFVVIGGWQAFKSYRAAQREAASASLAAFGVEGAEEAVAAYGDTDAGGALKIKLAKKYYDAGRYEEALEIYRELEGSVDAAFADIPSVGIAQALEAQGKTDEALAAYSAFVEANPGSYLALSANLGVVRCMAKTDKTAALAKLAEIAESVKDDEISAARVEALKDVIERL